MIEFTVKVTNQSQSRQTGQGAPGAHRLAQRTSRSMLARRHRGRPAVRLSSRARRDRSSGRSRARRPGADRYKAVGASDKLSDGEEGMLPGAVAARAGHGIDRRCRSAAQETKTFDFAKLLESGESNTLQNETLTVQMVSQPAWYAVMALPYLMEYPYECTEQTFNRLYANALARHIANSDPKIRKVFDQWKNTPALESPLEKNQDLKAVMLEETPWLREAVKESQARRNVGILFDDNRLNEETGRLTAASWPRCSSPTAPGRGSPAGRTTITSRSTSRPASAACGTSACKIDQAPAVKSLTRLDAWVDQMYRDILKHGHPEENHLSSTDRALSLRPQLLPAGQADRQGAPGGRRLLARPGARSTGCKLANRQSQAHLALALKRFGDKETPPRRSWSRSRNDR